MDDDIGVITICYTVKFERRSKHSVARLWRAITEAEEIAAWMGAPARVDLRPGGEYFVDFHGNGEPGLDGILVRVEPEHRLGHVWGLSYQEFELHEDGDGATFTFVQNGVADRGEDADEEGLAAGWHEFFDRLDDHLDHMSRTEDEHTARWQELKPSYRKQLDRVIRKLG
ncbi:MAG: SRPBCC domain-containing protein [Acidimicrobiales bacterium]